MKQHLECCHNFFPSFDGLAQIAASKRPSRSRSVGLFVLVSSYIVFSFRCVDYASKKAAAGMGDARVIGAGQSPAKRTTTRSLALNRTAVAGCINKSSRRTVNTYETRANIDDWLSGFGEGAFIAFEFKLPGLLKH